MRFQSGLMGVCLLGMLNLMTVLPIWSECPSQTLTAVMVTPLSSRINHRGDALEARLTESIMLNEQLLRSGTRLLGRVTDVESGRRKDGGRIQVLFDKLADDVKVYPVSAAFATEDAWLRISDADTAVWSVSLMRSTRLLSQKLMRKLGADRAVWNQILGLNQNSVIDPSSDAFMREYNRHDVLIGSGDRVRVFVRCP